MVPTDYFAVPSCQPVRHLTLPKKKRAGRDHRGRIVVRFRGGGFRRRLRLVDTRRQCRAPQKILRIEHDPHRSAKLALVRELGTGELAYILAPDGVAPDQVITNDAQGNIGNCLPLQDIPDGCNVFNIEMRPGETRSYYCCDAYVPYTHVLYTLTHSILSLTQYSHPLNTLTHSILSLTEHTLNADSR